MSRRLTRSKIQCWAAWGLAGLMALLPFATLTWQHLKRPPRTPLEQALFEGITYRRMVRSRPRPLVLHIVEIDLTEPSLQVQVTPGTPATDRTEIDARTTTEFLQEFGLDLAVNGNFFYTFREETPWDFYPHSGDRVHAVGEAIANGHRYSEAEETWPVLCFDQDNRARIADHICPPGTQQGVSGSHILMEQGIPVPPGDQLIDIGIHSRTVAALDAAGETLWLIAIDDKQPRYSEGVTLAELIDLLGAMGIDSAINLDGGGSTTLVMSSPVGARLLNSPIHTKIPMRERPVANHLGFRAAPPASGFAGLELDAKP